MNEAEVFENISTGLENGKNTKRIELRLVIERNSKAER